MNRFHERVMFFLEKTVIMGIRIFQHLDDARLTIKDMYNLLKIKYPDRVINVKVVKESKGIVIDYMSNFIATLNTSYKRYCYRQLWLNCFVIHDFKSVRCHLLVLVPWRYLQENY